MKISWGKLLGFIVLCEAVGILGSLFTVAAIPSWYAALNKPWFSPPNWLFGPVWTLLYLLMGIAGYMLWQNKGTGKAAKLALVFFFIQLVLNGVWTPLFFGAHLIAWAFVEIVLMLLFILLTIIFSFKTKPKAAILLLPYLFWVSFASLLNFSLWQLNK